jgi:hypothetical protein
MKTKFILWGTLALMGSGMATGQASLSGSERQPCNPENMCTPAVILRDIHRETTLDLADCDPDTHQCKDDTATSFVYVDRDSWQHWCETDAPSRYTPPITVHKGNMWCPSGSHLMVSDSVCGERRPCNFIAPSEPIDIDAVDDSPLILFMCNGPTCINNHTPPPHWTCADKSRILLTDESGGKHCLKFPKETP